MSTKWIFLVCNLFCNTQFIIQLLISIEISPRDKWFILIIFLTMQSIYSKIFAIFTINKALYIVSEWQFASRRQIESNFYQKCRNLSRTFNYWVLKCFRLAELRFQTVLLSSDLPGTFRLITLIKVYYI